MSNPTQTTLSFWNNLNPNNPPVISYRDTLFFNKYQYKLVVRHAKSSFVNLIGYPVFDIDHFPIGFKLKGRKDVRLHLNWTTRCFSMYTSNYDLLLKVAKDSSEFNIREICFAKNCQIPKNTILVNKLPFDKYKYRVSISSKLEHNQNFRNLIEWAADHPDVHLPKGMKKLAYKYYGNRYCLVADEATLLMVKFLLCGATNKIDQYMEKKK